MQHVNRIWNYRNYWGVKYFYNWNFAKPVLETFEDCYVIALLRLIPNMFLRCSYFWRTFQPRIILIKQECNFTLCCCQFCKLTLNKIIKMRYNTANVVNLNSKYYGTYRHAEGRLFIWHFILIYFFCPSKVWSMLNHGPVWASSE